MKNKQIKVSVLLIVFMLFMQTLTPMTIYGAANVTEKDKQINLYQVTQSFAIDDSITIEEETLIYGKEVSEDLIEIQYADTYITLPSSNIQGYEGEEENIPEFVEYESDSDLETIPLELDSSLYSLYPDNAERITVTSDIDYPIYISETGIETVYLGNIAFYLSEEDRELIEELNAEGQPGDSAMAEKDTTEEEQSDSSEKGSDGENTNEEAPKSDLGEEAEEQPVSNEKESGQAEEQPESIEEESDKAEEQPDSTEEESSKAEEQDLTEDPNNLVEEEKQNLEVDETEKNAIPEKEEGLLDDPSETDQGEDAALEESVETEIVESEEILEEKVLEDESRKKNSISSFSTTAVDPWKESSADYFKVKENNLVVYTKGNTRVLGTLVQNQVYPIEADYGNWHKIQYGDTSGYVYKASTVPDDGRGLENENGNYANSTVSFTTLEDTPIYDNSTGELVEFGTIKNGESYPIVSNYGNWWRIVFADRVGYVSKSKVREEFTGGEDHFSVVVNNLPIYDNRTGKLIKIGTLTKGQTYEVVSDYGNWHRIQYNNHYGYVSKSGTEPSSENEIKNRNTKYNHSDRTFYALNDIAVYDNSSGSLVEFGTIDKDQSYYIASDYGNWWRIVFADRVGYVKKDKVRLNFFNTDDYFKTQVDKLAVYDNSGASLVKIGELRKGQVYPRVSSYGANWHKVNFGDGYGYVYTEGTEPGSALDIANLNKSYSHSNNKIIADQDTEVMDNTTGKLIPFGEITEGTLFPIASDYGNWWRIVFLDRVGYVNKDSVSNHGTSESNYDLTLDKAVEIQSTASPQTDKEYDTYVSKQYINSSNKVTATTLNVRGGPGTAYWTVGQLSKGAAVTILDEINGWYQIEFTKNRQWVNASPMDISYYLDPLNFLHDERQKFQFLDLSRSSDASASVLNKFLNGKGTLHGQGQAFIDASRIHGVNDVYLASHAMLETGNGNSRLAQGVKHNGVTVYNMFGVGAYDSCAISCGAAKAYEEGWTTPYKAIVGGAKFIGNEYIKGENNEGRVLNTLYKMRWNPLAMAETGRFGKQYATDIGWASKQVSTMYNIYQQMDSYTLYLDIPNYKK